VKKKRGKTARKKSLMLFELVSTPAISIRDILERRFVPYGCLLIREEVEL